MVSEKDTDSMHENVVRYADQMMWELNDARAEIEGLRDEIEELNEVNEELQEEVERLNNNIL